MRGYVQFEFLPFFYFYKDSVDFLCTLQPLYDAVWSPKLKAYLAPGGYDLLCVSSRPSCFPTNILCFDHCALAGGFHWREMSYTQCYTAILTQMSRKQDIFKIKNKIINNKIVDIFRQVLITYKLLLFDNF